MELNSLYAVVTTWRLVVQAGKNDYLTNSPPKLDKNNEDDDYSSSFKQGIFQTVLNSR